MWPRMRNREAVPDGRGRDPGSAKSRAAAIRVLVVDDDPAGCALTLDALRWLPCETSAAASAAEALELASALGPHVIVVCAALAEPLGALLRDGALSSTPIIALAAAGAGVPVADVILRAPVDALELLATVRLLAAHGAPDPT